MRNMTPGRELTVHWIVGLMALLIGSVALGQVPTSVHQQTLRCGETEGILCTEQYDSPGYEYIGHDEPSVLFYSNRAGSGSNNVYRLRLPKDPQIRPRSDGLGGTWNFQLHPAFWFGMALCDSQSYPEYTQSCPAASDSNIYDSADPANSHYIGKHPGTAFMEMQFYPPGWIYTSYDPTHWTAALNIDSLSQDGNSGQLNNGACQNYGVEYVNFAFIQTDGTPAGPPNPFQQDGNTFTPNQYTLLMNPGDELVVTEEDTPHGLKITIKDLTTGQTGFMAASAHNGFGQILWDPSGNDCNPATHNIAYDFHPMYATSSEHTRVPWAAHTYNIAFADEIGHFQYCDVVDPATGNCTASKAESVDADDQVCVNAATSAFYGFLPIGGCVAADVDFDGVPYKKAWPGTFANRILDRLLHAEPVIFSSPLFRDGRGKMQNYQRVAFEADLPRIEQFTNPPCQRHVLNPADPSPGAGCTNPPTGADFYPIFTTRVTDDGTCRWQLGGAKLPLTDQTFGGTSTAEYGPLLKTVYSGGSGGLPSTRYNNFRRVLDENPCPARSD
jgi:hypothetical protein